MLGFFLYHINLLFFFSPFPYFQYFSTGRTHPQFCGCQHWFWGSKKSVKILDGMWWRMVEIFGGDWGFLGKMPYQTTCFSPFLILRGTPSESLPWFVGLFQLRKTQYNVLWLKSKIVVDVSNSFFRLKVYYLLHGCIPCGWVSRARRWAGRSQLTSTEW